MQIEQLRAVEQLGRVNVAWMSSQSDTQAAADKKIEAIELLYLASLPPEEAEKIKHDVGVERLKQISVALPITVADTVGLAPTGEW